MLSPCTDSGVLHNRTQWCWEISSFGQLCQWLSESHYSCLLQSRRWIGPLYILFRFHHFSSYTSFIAHGRFAPYSLSVLLWFLISCVFLLMCGIVAVVSFWIERDFFIHLFGLCTTGVCWGHCCFVCISMLHSPDRNRGPRPSPELSANTGESGGSGGVTGPWGLFLSPGCQPVLLETK